jgi:hypothetical protein
MAALPWPVALCGSDALPHPPSTRARMEPSRRHPLCGEKHQDLSPASRGMMMTPHSPPHGPLPASASPPASRGAGMLPHGLPPQVPLPTSASAAASTRPRGLASVPESGENATDPQLPVHGPGALPGLPPPESGARTTVPQGPPPHAPVGSLEPHAAVLTRAPAPALATMRSKSRGGVGEDLR